LLKDLESGFPTLYEFHLSRCDRVVEAVMRRISPRKPQEPWRQP
jgi:hypothetical protein